METDSSLPGSPVGGPLQAITNNERASQRESVGSVHDKISQFNSMSIAMQSKQLERKTADAALKRAMLGREEAEAELRRNKQEIRSLHKAIEDGRERERRVGERLEAVMEQYGRAKETHSHTQALWEKEIRRARKETFKTQSTHVKLQEDLKTARSAVKILEESIEREKERCHAREQEAFEARYEIVGVQEQLDQALERVKVVEQERDAYKTAAQNEEVARIAAEGRIPLPKTDPNDEFASPVKKTQKKRKISGDPRYSLSTFEIESSAAMEMEVEELADQVQWEKRRADRALEMVDFLQAECENSWCACGRKKQRTSLGPSPRQLAQTAVEEPMAEDPEEDVPLALEPRSPVASPRLDPALTIAPPEPTPQSLNAGIPAPKSPQSKKEPRRSTIFCPKEGIFRTVSEQEAQDLQEDAEVDEVDTPLVEEPAEDRRMYARTPSVEPPSFALIGQTRTSLLSLLNAPHGHEAPKFSVPAIQDARSHHDYHDAPEDLEPLEERPHTSATLYGSSTVTTKVPLRDEARSSVSFNEKLRTPSSSSNASFDTKNPALTPTMTREEALAKIRERRGRARSAANGAATPHKMMEGEDRRDMSAPTGKAKARS